MLLGLVVQRVTLVTALPHPTSVSYNQYSLSSDVSLGDVISYVQGPYRCVPVQQCRGVESMSPRALQSAGTPFD
jgi:hypothetical protein